MNRLRIFLVDAFTEEPFRGNPAGVVPLPHGVTLEESQMQRIALEMNQAETAFVSARSERNTFDLRWFTPTVEVDLCGHATLASAHTLWESGTVPSSEAIQFHTRSGVLTATKSEDGIVLNFPAETATPSRLPGELTFAKGIRFSGRNRMDWLIELEPGTDLPQLVPDYREISELGLRGLIVTVQAPLESSVDFISRFFAPTSGVPEDPVTGSAHCCLGPYWSAKLQKDTVTGYQASPRGGYVKVTVLGERVLLMGVAVTTLEGEIRCP